MEAETASEAAMGHPLVTTVGSAVATLTVILASALVAQHGGGTPRPEDPRLQLTDLARRALDSLPLAYQAEDTVVVPAATDESVEWTRLVRPAWLEGPPLPIGTRGLLPYGRLSGGGRAPGWTDALSPADRVFTDVGPLWLACVAWPDSEGCSPTVLMYHDVGFYAFASHFGPFDPRPEGHPMTVVAFDSVGGTEVGQVLIGGMAGVEVARVRLRLVDGSRRPAWTSTAVGPSGATMWWATVWEPVEAVTAYDRAGGVVAEVPMRGS